MNGADGGIERRLSGKFEDGSHDNTMGEIVGKNLFSFEKTSKQFLIFHEGLTLKMQTKLFFFFSFFRKSFHPKMLVKFPQRFWLVEVDEELSRCFPMKNWKISFFTN
jgi:hypothetical protein